MDLILSCPFHLFVHLVLFFSLSSGFPHVAAHSPHAGNETDKLALLAFKAATTDNPSGALTSWNASIHFCQWVGVTCGRQHQRVIALILQDQKLTGSISPHVGNLSFLRDLRLANNSLSHKIPPELGRLQRLQMLSLRNNSITGEIPTNISACLNLVTLELSLNKLAGKIHMELGSLSKLERFSFRRNNLVGEVPSTFGNLSSLQKLFAAGNEVSGNIPDALGRLTNLQVLELEVNRLVGTIPSSIFNLSSMVDLNVAANQLRGRLPSDLGVTFTNLEFLGLSDNLFTGYIPISISNASKIQRLAIERNKFTGKVPPLEKLHDLQWLWFGDNQLGAGEVGDLSFLSSLTNATNLVSVSLRNNSFGGKLPESVSNFSMNLNALLLDNNKIFGSIPTGIGNLVKLQQIDLWENQFTEYGMGNEVSTSGDVYSYGILLLEIFTGKKPTDDMFNGSLCLHNFAKMVFSEQVVSIVDPTLIQQIEKGDANLNINNAHNQSSDSSHKIHECVASILKVGIACSQELPRDRPTINDVVTQLHVIKDTLLGTGGVHGGIKLELRCHNE